MDSVISTAQKYYDPPYANDESEADNLTGLPS